MKKVLFFATGEKVSPFFLLKKLLDQSSAKTTIVSFLKDIAVFHDFSYKSRRSVDEIRLGSSCQKLSLQLYEANLFKRENKLNHIEQMNKSYEYAK